MAFPGTYNIEYYKGDTLEFAIYPKNTSGGSFSIANFNNVSFTISNFRGETSSSGEEKVTIQAYAEFVSNQYIKCAIRPIDGNGNDTVENPGMIGGRSYVYDVEIAKQTSPYDEVYTLLTGNISVQDQVTTPDITTPAEPVLDPPNAPTNVTATSFTDTTITMSWTAPTTPPAFTGYKVYILANPALGDDIGDATFVEDIASNLTSYTYTGLTPATMHVIGLTAYNTTDSNLDQESLPAAYSIPVTTEAGS